MSATGASHPAGSDAAVITASQADPQAFTLIFERHAPTVFRYLGTRVERAAAEDLLSDVFVTAFRVRDRYDMTHQSALPWLLGIATNAVRHHRRSEARRSSMLRRVAAAHRYGDAPDSSDAVTASAERRGQLDDVRLALEELDDRDREVLLAAGSGLTYEELSRVLSIQVGTVRSRLSRARTRLRELLVARGQYSEYLDASPGSRVRAEEQSQ